MAPEPLGETRCQFRTPILRHPPAPPPRRFPTAGRDAAARLRFSDAPTPALLPTAIRRALPSLSWLADTPDAAVQCPEEVAALAGRIEDAVAAVRAMQEPTDVAEIVRFLSMVAERRGMVLPSPSLLALDAKAISAAVPADLWPVACARLWTNFAYRRLPECSDFLAAVADELAERQDAAAKVHTAHLKVQHLRWLAERRRECDARHAADKARERALYPAASAPNFTNANRGAAVAACGLRPPVSHGIRANPPCDRNLKGPEQPCDRNLSGGDGSTEGARPAARSGASLPFARSRQCRPEAGRRPSDRPRGWQRVGGVRRCAGPCPARRASGRRGA